MKKLILQLIIVTSFISQSFAQDKDVRTIVQTGHLTAIIDYDVSADGKFVATLDKSDKTILWNLKTGHQYRDFNEKDAEKLYFNSRSNALIVVCDKKAIAFDIATGKRISYWRPPEEKYLVKRIPKNIRCDIKGNGILVTDVSSGRKLAELKSLVDPVYSVIPIKEKLQAGKQPTDDIWWVSEKNPVQWNLKTGQISNRISLSGYNSSLWLDAKENLVFWNGKNLLSRYDSGNGNKIDDIKLSGQGYIHALAFLSDNKTIVYDRKNRIWTTNLITHRSDSLPYVDYIGKISDIMWKGEGKGDVVTKERHYWHGPNRESIKPFGNLGSVSKVVGLGSMTNPKEYFVLFDDVWTPLKMKLGSTTGTIGGNTQDFPKSLYRMGNGLDLIRGSYMVSLLSDLTMVGKYADNNVTCASMFGNNLVATGSKDGSLRLFDKTSSRMKKILTTHNTAITSINQGPSHHIAMTTSNDGTIGVYNTQQQKLVAYLMSCDNGREYIIRTPDNYYMSSRYGTDAIHFAVGSETYRFDQFDLKYNRPDIVLSRIGLADVKQIKMLKRAYEKRLRRMHFTEEMLSEDFHVPTLNIKNANQLAQAKTPDQILQIEAQDSQYKIVSLNVWINGVPVFGADGINVGQRKKLSMKHPITLAQGHNIIQVSCTNERGAESFRETIETNLPMLPYKPDLWIVTLGVSQYKDQRFTLNYASKDATDLAIAIRNSNKTNYKNVHTLTLTDYDVNKDAIEKIRGFLSEATRNDAVVLSYAGHGLIDQSLDYYLGTYETDFSSPSSNSILYDDFESLLDGIQPLQKLLLIDACHSGELDKEDIMLAQAQNRKTTNNITFRSAGERLPQVINATAEELEAVLSENFSNLRRGSGATVISSSSGIQVSVESDKWKNGLFSYCIMQGLRDKRSDTNGDGKISIGELQQYCQHQVLELSGGKQRPSSRIENRQNNFVIGNY